jgi:Icc protein
MIVKLGVVADIHHGADEVTKKGTAALALLEQVLAAAKSAAVDAVIDLGDRISDVSPAIDDVLAGDVGLVFGRSGLVRHHICGNHDRACLTAAANAAALQAETGSRVHEIAGLRLILWQPEVRSSAVAGPRLGTADLAWLVDALAASDSPTLLFSHVPLSGQSMTGNFWFENNPGHAAYPEQAQIRAALAEAACPLVAFAGHVHWNSLTIVDGVAHVTLQSLSETSATFPHPAGAFGLIEIGQEALRWPVSGRDPCAAELPWPPRRRFKLRPLPPFATMRGDPIATLRAEIENGRLP